MTPTKGYESIPDGPWPRVVTFVLPLPEPLPFAHHSTYFVQTGDVIDEFRGAVGYVDERLDKPLPGPAVQGVSVRFWQVEAPVGLTPADEAGPNVLRAIKPDLLPTERPDGQEPWRGISEEEFAVLTKGRGPQWESVSYSDLNLSKPPINYTTVAELTTFVRRHPALGPDPDGLDPFTRCLYRLQQLVRAYRLADHGTLVGRLGYQRLPPMVFHFWRDPTDAETGGFLGDAKALLLNHANTLGLGIARQPVDQETHNAINHFVGRLGVHDPFVLAAEHLHDGRRSFQTEGDTAASALNYAMASEILLDGLLGHLLWEEDVERGSPDLDRAAAELSRDLARRVRSSFHHRLGGDWSTTGSGPIASWRRDVAHLRGRIVHRGYRPSLAESDSCSRAAVQLFTFVKERLAERMLTYPRTTFVLLQGEGLRRRGLWPRFEPWARAHEGEPDYGLWYSQWRDAVDGKLRESGRF